METPIVNFAWLRKWTYTEEVYRLLWVPWEYIETNWNLETIEWLIKNYWFWILPYLNVYGWPVDEVMSNIRRVKGIELVWTFKHRILHVLAWSWNIQQLKEIKAHPQAIMQCADSLTKIWANPDLIFNDAYKTPNLRWTEQFILEIEDENWSLATALEVFADNNISLEFIHSRPYWKNKFRFYILVNKEGKDIINAADFSAQLWKSWWKLILNEEIENQKNQKIILTWTNTNVDWINEAKNDPKIWVICSEEAASRNWLEILDKQFCPSDNETHFGVFSTNEKGIAIPAFHWLVKDRVISILWINNSQIPLYKYLQIIKEAWLSLSFIMSINDFFWWYNFPMVIENNPKKILEVQKRIWELWWKFRVL